MHNIIQKVHIHMPYHLLERYQPMILEHRLNPELYFNHHTLSSIDRDDCRMHAGIFKTAVLKVTGKSRHDGITKFRIVRL